MTLYELTENLYVKEKTGASSHVGHDTAVKSTVLCSYISDLQILTTGDALNLTSQLTRRQDRHRETKRETKENTYRAICIDMYRYLWLNLNRLISL